MPTRTTETTGCLYISICYNCALTAAQPFFLLTLLMLSSAPAWILFLSPQPLSLTSHWVLPDKSFVTSPSSTVSSTSNHPCVCRPPPLKFSLFSGTYSFLTPFSEEEVFFSKPKAESLSTLMAFHLFWNLILPDKSSFPNLQSLALFLLCVQPY